MKTSGRCSCGFGVSYGGRHRGLPLACFQGEKIGARFLVEPALVGGLLALRSRAGGEEDDQGERQEKFHGAHAKQTVARGARRELSAEHFQRGVPLAVVIDHRERVASGQRGPASVAR